MKKILFVDRNYDVQRWQEKFEYIAESLRRKYEVQTYRDLDSGIIDIICQALTEKPFDGLVTHVPYGRDKSYEWSLNILSDVKKVADIPIIAYTGAGPSLGTVVSFLGRGYIDEMIDKSRDCEVDIDIKRICNTVEQLMEEYKREPLDIGPPEIITKGKFITAEVKTRGFSCGCAAKIVRQCNEYPKATILEKLGPESKGWKCSGKSIMDVFTIAPFNGEKISISVEGKGKKAKEHLLRLYTLYGARYIFDD